ncbi:MAG: hypothetical protein SGARI_000128 [Bacillariaceae sp.]
MTPSSPALSTRPALDVNVNASKGSNPPTSLVQSLLSGDGLSVGAAGMIVNDPNGLLLMHKGSDLNVGPATNNDTGVYTSLARLASQLRQGGASKNNSNNGGRPLITMEFDASDSTTTNSAAAASCSILVKDYDGHTVALKVPKSIAGGGVDNSVVDSNAASSSTAEE